MATSKEKEEKVEEKVETTKTTKKDAAKKNNNKTKVSTSVAKTTAKDKKSEKVEKVTNKKVSESNEGDVVKSERQLTIDGSVDTSTEVDYKIDNKKEIGKNLQDIDKKIVVPFERKTRIKKYKENRTIKSLHKDWKKGLLRFDLAIQRNDVWTNDQRSMLIHSLLYGYPIPPVYVHEGDDNSALPIGGESSSDALWYMDGRQRTTTLMTFLDGQWALSKNTPDVFGHSISGCKFADLPEDMRDVIEGETIDIIRMKDMAEEEVDEMFVRLNSGSSLTKMEMTRAMHSSLIERINKVGELKFFKDKISLTAKARNRFVDQEIILQIAMLMEEGVENIKGFGANHIRDFVVRLRNSEQTISDELVEKFETMNEYLIQAFEDFEPTEVKKTLKKIHVPIIFYVATLAINKGIEAKHFGDFVRSFLITSYSVDSVYGVSCQAGSSKRENVITRLNEMTKAFDMFAEEMMEANNVFKAIGDFNQKLQQKVVQQVREIKGIDVSVSFNSDEENE